MLLSELQDSRIKKKKNYSVDWKDIGIAGRKFLWGNSN